MFKRANRESLPYIFPLKKKNVWEEFFSLIAPFRSRIKYYINFFSYLEKFMWRDREGRKCFICLMRNDLLFEAAFLHVSSWAWKTFCAHFSAAALMGAVSMRNKKGAQYGKGMISEGIPDKRKFEEHFFWDWSVWWIFKWSNSLCHFL